MKLVPLLKFWGRKQTDGESDILDEFPEETLQLPPEDQPTDSTEEEEKTEEEKEAETEEEGSEKTEDTVKDGLLSVFTSVDEEFIDNSALMDDLEDVPADELLEELRTLATALNVRPQRSAGTPQSEE